MPSNNPFGFRPYRRRGGGTFGAAREYPIVTGYATAIYTGDPVKLANDGTIQLAAAGDRTLGIFNGVSYTDSIGQQIFSRYWPASAAATNIKATVYDDPGNTFLVQSGGTPTQTNVGNLANHVAGTGSTLTGQSGAYLDSTMGTGSAGFRILDIAKLPGNSGQYALLEVELYLTEHSINAPATPGV